MNNIPNIFLPIQDTPEAQKDPRYLEVWLKYAAISAQPLEVYDYMFKNGKCSQQAGLYDAWAWHLESQAHYKLAEKIYGRGIDALTDREAKAGLEQRKQQFQAGLRIRIHFIRIRIQHFRLNTDPDPDPFRIQGFIVKKIGKKLQLRPP